MTQFYNFSTLHIKNFQRGNISPLGLPPPLDYWEWLIELLFETKHRLRPSYAPSTPPSSTAQRVAGEERGAQLGVVVRAVGLVRVVVWRTERAGPRGGALL